MKLVLAEKPSVAQSIAKVLGANKREDGYLEGGGYVVSWCVGHLVELAEPESYAYAKKRYNDEYENLLEEENRLFASSKKLDHIVATSSQWIQFVKEYRRIPEIDRKAVEYLIKRINIYPNKRIQIILNYEDPFRLVTEYLEEIPEVLEDAG